MSEWTMFDSANPEAIPRNVNTVAGYVNGYEWSNADFDLFPHAVKCLIAVEMDSAGRWKLANIFDIENGALTAEQARECVRWRQDNGKKCNGIYCSLSNRGYIQSVMRGMDYYEWLADWTNEPHMVEGSIATQWQSTSAWDRSLVDGDWRHELSDANRPWPLA